MHGNESAENYLETILVLSRRLPVVRSVDIATELDFKKSSVSVAMKKLRESGHIIVSPEGYININDIGLVYLSGMTVKEADGYMRRKLNQIYSVSGDDAKSEMKLTLGSIRTIQVNILGEVAMPGTYYISSFSNVYHAVYRAGGVNSLGSLRDIQLRRNPCFEAQHSPAARGLDASCKGAANDIAGSAIFRQSVPCPDQAGSSSLLQRHWYHQSLYMSISLRSVK